MPRSGRTSRDRSRLEEIVAAAREIVETDGPDALTMRQVAARLGVREPSLYKHCRGREEVLAGVAASGLRELAEGRVQALDGVTGGLDALGRLAAWQREFAARHPHLYRVMFDRPFDRQLVAQPDAEAWGPVVEILGSEERVWAALAFAHGMLELERTGRLAPGPRLEAIWQVGLEAFAGLIQAGDRAPAPDGLERELRAHREFVAALRDRISTFLSEHPGTPAP